MFLAKIKRHKGFVLFLLILFFAYTALSFLIGFPLGFGTSIAKGYARDYCEVIYPNAVLESTRFNPVSNSFSTHLSEGDTEFWLSCYPYRETITDNLREKATLKEYEIWETVDRFEIRNGIDRDRDATRIGCRIGWLHADPMHPVFHLSIDERDSASEPLPDDEEVKEILSPIILGYYHVLTEKLPIQKIFLSYYHPDYDPEEQGMTWRTMSIVLEEGTFLTEELIAQAEIFVD